MRNFTNTFIKSLKPKEKRYEEYEGGGFGIRVTINGTKSWIYRFKFNNKTEKLTIGHYPSMSLAEAKKLFLEYKELKRTGGNPKDVHKPKAELENTVEALVQNWYKSYIEKHRKQPLQIKQHIVADIIPKLGHFELDKLQTRDITKALDAIVNRGSPVHANKVLSTLKQAFNYAVSRGDMLINPASGIRARDIGGAEKPRERFLTLDEIKTLWLFLDGDSHGMSIQVKNAIKIILLTGIRSGELRLAKWAELDFSSALWTIPASNTKIGTVMRVHLTPLVISLFTELQSYSTSEYIISGADGISPLSDKALPRAINRIQERVGIPHWTAHDLRRTFATQLGETLNIDPVVIEKCLGHKMPKIMATYNKNEMLPQRAEALTRWTACIKQLATPSSDTIISEPLG